MLLFVFVAISSLVSLLNSHMNMVIKSRDVLRRWQTNKLRQRKFYTNASIIMCVCGVYSNVEVTLPFWRVIDNCCIEKK